jgi:hypothetical protein
VTPAVSPGAGGSTAVAIHFTDEPSELTSPTHELGGTRRDATLSDPHSDHDAIVRWRAPAASAGWVESDAETERSPGHRAGPEAPDQRSEGSAESDVRGGRMKSGLLGGVGFAAVVVEGPPAAPIKAAIRVILAIDRAATTRGDGDAIEHPLVRALLGTLDRADRVRVIGSDAVAWNAPDETRKAIERVWATPAGAFDLTRVLEAAHPEGAAIVLVSDGLVADDAAAIAAAKRLGVPVHVIGIGPAPARATLLQIAAATGGTLRYAVAGDDIPALARAVLADVARPPAPLSVNWGTLAASDIEPAVLPRLGAGQAMLVLARVRRGQAANARVRGEVFAFEALPPGPAVLGATTPRGPLARRWARERLGDLVAGKHDRNAVTSHALAYGLVSPYTSFVAVGSDVIVSGGVKHSVAVPVSLPAGMQWHAVQQAIDLDTRLDTSAGPAPEPPSASPVPERYAASATPTAKAPPAPAPAPTKHRRPTGGKARDEADDKPRPARKEPKRRNEKPATTAAPPSAVLDVATQAPAKGAVSTADTERAPAEALDEDQAERGEVRTAALGRVSGSEETVEAITIANTTYPRAWRLTAALGGGLVFDRGARGLLALDARLETTRRTRFGAEAALWLVGASELEGRALITVARSGLARWIELGFGAGVQFGNGTGIAGSLRVRANTPLTWLAGALRYDAAVLPTRPSLQAEQAVTLGLELSY